MIDTMKLRGKIMTEGRTIRDLANIIAVNEHTLGKKIRNEAPMSLNEAYLIQHALGIKDEDFRSYFFCPMSCKTQQDELGTGIN